MILFDIDATLLVSGGAGIAAMEQAGKELFGDRFSAQGLDVAGRLDPLIIGEMLDRAGVPRSPRALADFRGLYGLRLAALLAVEGRARALPGVPALLTQLRERGETIGLLTGNFQETGEMKLRACGIDPAWFFPRVWGDDSPHDPPARDHLPMVAMDRYKAHREHPVDQGRLIIVGDTPHDVRCAKVHHGRCLAVATGRYGVAELAAAGADWVMNDLRETDTALGCLLS